MLQLTAKVKEWFPVPQDESGECMVEIIHLKPGEISAIEAKSNDIVGKQIGDDFQTEIGFKLHERTKAYVLACVVGIKGFKDRDGRDVKCNKVGILSILEEYGWFADFVEECREDLAKTVEDREEDADPN